LGHAEADKLAKKVIAEGLSVRAVEALVASAKISKPKAASKARPAEKDADTRALEKTLSDRLGLSVAIDDKGDNLGGRVTIEYKTLDQLDAVIVRLTSGSH
jgi:ParB family chromosome partitioning protein